MRIGIASVGDPNDPTTWSGTPRGLLDGFAQLGHDVVPLDVMPRRLHRVGSKSAIAIRRRLSGEAATVRSAYRGSLWGRDWSATLSANARRVIGRSNVDLVIQAGDGWSTGHPNTVLYIDMTEYRGNIEQEFHSRDAPLTQSTPLRDTVSFQAYHSALAVCTATPWAARSVITDYGLSSHRVHPVGIGTRQPTPAWCDKDRRIPHYLFVGMNFARKNGPGVIKAFQEVVATCPEATLDVVGDAPEFSDPRITRHGILRRNSAADQQTLQGLYDRTTALVVPGRFEAAGIVFVEAGHASLASICGIRGGAPDIVGPGGLAADGANVAALARAMSTVALPGENLRFARAGYERSRDMTWRDVAERILAASVHERSPAALDSLWSTRARRVS